MCSSDLDATDRALTARLPGSAPPRIAHSPEMTVAAQELLEFLRQRFYRSERVLLVMRDGAERIRRRFAAFVQDPHKLPPSHRDRIEREGLHRVICDYVAGMTDRYLLAQT